MGWYLCESLATFRDQVDAEWPFRDKSSDGTIGDEAHSQSESDHNPNEEGAVTAIDITHDPGVGPDCNSLAETLRHYKDKRIQYIIWNKQICNPDIEDWAWRPYSGSNPHTMHMHMSVRQDQLMFDDPSIWEGIESVTLVPPTEVAVRSAPPLPKLQKGMTGDAVRALQLLMEIPNTGIFDSTVEAVVRDFQGEMDLVVDGIVGRYTWEEIVCLNDVRPPDAA